MNEYAEIVKELHNIYEILSKIGLLFMLYLFIYSLRSIGK